MLVYSRSECDCAQAKEIGRKEKEYGGEEEKDETEEKEKLADGEKVKRATTKRCENDKDTGRSTVRQTDR